MNPARPAEARGYRSPPIRTNDADLFNGPPANPWRPGDVASMLVLNLVAAILIIAGFVMARSTADPGRVQIATNIASGGLLVALAGNLVWLFGVLREVTGLRRSVLGVPPASPDRTPDIRAAPEQLVAGPSMTRYHRESCILVRGKEVKTASLSAHRRAGRLPCGVCMESEPAR